MSVKKKRQEKLIQLFQVTPIVETDTIQQELGITKRSVKLYVKELRDLGYDIIGRTGYYKYLGSDTSTAINLGMDDYRALCLLHIIGKHNGSLNRRELIKAYRDFLTDQDVIHDKTIIRAIEALVANNSITLTNEKKYELRTGTEFLSDVDMDDISGFIDYCDMYSDFLPSPNATESLKEKIMEQSGFDHYDVTIHSIGRSYHYDRSYVSTLERFKHYSYKKNNLTISFKTKQGLLTRTISVVTFLYHAENDRHYVLGVYEEQPIFILVDSIETISQRDEPNTYFGHADYIRKFNYMFGASFDGIHHVKVKFDNVFNIKEKVEKLAGVRYYSRVTYSHNSLLYEDTLSGLYDFARLLRTFGSSCQVLEPPELRSIMKASYQRILNNYDALDEVKPLNPGLNKTKQTEQPLEGTGSAKEKEVNDHE